MPDPNQRAATPPTATEERADKEDTNVQAESASNIEDRPVPQDADPPLPYDEEPPLPDEPPPSANDDGWDAKWDYNANAWYFYNRNTGMSQWENPRVPGATGQSQRPYDRALESSDATATSSDAPPPKRKWGGYNPAIHGSYDPKADYAKEAEREEEEAQSAEAAASAAVLGLSNPNGGDYATTAQFNRFTGKFQHAGQGPEMHNDENKSKRQMNAFFDVDAAANSHDGRSLKEERRKQTLSKKELKAYKAKRREKKEEKRRAWLLD